MKSIWEKFKKLPKPLRSVIGLRMMVGGAALVLFIIIWILMGDITLAIPCAALGAYLLVSGGLLVHRDFLCITGTVKEIVTTVWFRVGKKVYDSEAEDHRRWVNLNIKGFTYMVDRVKKMQLKEGMYINIRGRLDEDVWTDKNDVTHRSLYIVAEDIEYAGSRPQDDSESSTAPAKQPEKAPLPTEAPGEFTGYESFGGTSFFDGDD